MSGLARRILRSRQPKEIEPEPQAQEWFRPLVAIATPCQDLCHTVYTASLVRMAMRSLVAGLQIQFLHFGTSILPFSRQVLAAKAMEIGATHVLWIDSDMGFPEDTALRLLAHRLPIVAANCMARRPPFAMTARIGDEEVFTTAESTGLQRVDRCGTGLVLVSTDVFKAIPLPWFYNAWLVEKSIPQGEDFFFCERAREAGFEIHIDHDLSKQVEHMSLFGLNPLMKQHMVVTEGER